MDDLKTEDKRQTNDNLQNRNWGFQCQSNQGHCGKNSETDWR